MKNDRLRDLIKNKDSKISAEEYRLRYASERFLARLQRSQYRDYLILKGGFLLGIIFKIEQRTTKDLDTVLHGISADEHNVQLMLEDIISIDLEDGIQFQLLKIQEEQEHRIYTGFRAKFKMIFNQERTEIKFDLDIGVGDVITPEPVLVEIPFLFNERRGEKSSISLLAYNLDTILAEKTEVILDLGISNSRMKDFYDLYLILNSPEKPLISNCWKALKNTWLFRNHKKINDETFQDWYFVIDELHHNEEMKSKRWPNYCKNREYVKNLEFETIIELLCNYLKAVEKEYKAENMNDR